MEEKYKIGRHEFTTREERENALKDLKKIKAIVERVDIDDPVQALAIYNLLREGDITFSSELGAAFFCDISDRVAQNSKKLLREKKKSRTRERAESRQSQAFKVTGIVCIVLAVICFLIYGYSEFSDRRSVRRLEELQEQKSISQAVNWYISRLQAKQEAGDQEAQAEESQAEAAQAETVIGEQQTPEVLQEYAALYAQYPDLIGWLRIEGTQIDLPVMQTADNEYYLHHNIDGEEDKSGTLFLDYRGDVLKPSANLIIYGHNMKNGSMFGELKQYLEAEFSSGHSVIQFDTIYEKQTYQLAAVCLSEVGYQDDGRNRYYNFIEAENAEDFQDFLEEVRETAVFDNTQDVSESDELLTLSTCNSYVEDGRLFLVAKKIQ